MSTKYIVIEDLEDGETTIIRTADDARIVVQNDYLGDLAFAAAMSVAA